MARRLWRRKSTANRDTEGRLRSRSQVLGWTWVPALVLVPVHHPVQPGTRRLPHGAPVQLARRRRLLEALERKLYERFVRDVALGLFEGVITLREKEDV
jgi:hypothetical protein